MLFQLFFTIPLTTVLAKTEDLLACSNLPIYGSTGIDGIKPAAGRVIFSQTGGSSCLDLYSCYEITGYLKNTKFMDNFFIGGDGNVITGTGWDGKNYRYSDYTNDLSIVFVGDYTDKPLPYNMAKTARNLVECGKEKEFIQHYFSVYTANDLECTNNDVLLIGNGIDEEIQTWPRYAKGGALKNC